MASQLKTDLGLEKMHFVIGRISDFGLHGKSKEGWKRMREVQVHSAESDAHGAWIDTDDLNGGDEKNRWANCIIHASNAPNSENDSPKKHPSSWGCVRCEATGQYSRGCIDDFS